MAEISKRRRCADGYPRRRSIRLNALVSTPPEERIQALKEAMAAENQGFPIDDNWETPPEI